MRERNNYEPSTVIFASVLLCLVLGPSRGLAQSSGGSYKITSSVQASGGGTSTGSGNKVIEGTAAQSASGGPQTAASISHVSGFWPTTLAQPALPQNGQTTFQFSANNYSAPEDLGALSITITRNGDTSAAASVDYATVNGPATQKSDFEYAAGRLTFAPGETSKAFQILINEDVYVEGNETFTVALNNPSGASLAQQNSATITIKDDEPESSANPIDGAQSFVHTHYHDFLNREPDPAGLQFWTNNIASCSADEQC